MNQRSRSTLFLIEQLIVVAVFAICSAACVRILTSAFLTARESKEMSSAILIAESAAESFKAFEGNAKKTAEFLDGTVENADSASAVIVYYNRQLSVCGKNDAYYILRLLAWPPEMPALPVLSGNVLVEKPTGEQLVAFSVAVRDYVTG